MSVYRTLITGASSGIGEAIALSIANHDSEIFITGRSEERLQLVMEKVKRKGSKCYYQIADVKDTNLANSIVIEAIEKMGGLDLLVANAGIGRFKNLEDFTDEDFDLQFDTNVKGVFVYLRPVVKYMKTKKTGQIIVTSSNLGLRTNARCGIYAATKHAVQAMVGALREELKGSGVKVATINPGSVDTPWFDGRDVDRSKMIAVEEVADAAMMIVQQGERSNIDHILIHPAKQ